MLSISSAASAQSVISLETPSVGKLTLSVIKVDTMKVDAISISATYFGNQADNVVYFVPVWKKKDNVEQVTFKFSTANFDMTKPFRVVLMRNGTVLKTFELSKRAEINGEILSRYKNI